MIDKTEFDKLSNKEKRIEIAKDVIQRIDTDNITAEVGALWDFNTEELRYNYDRYENIPTPQEYFNSTECELCAKGALICSWIGNFNQYDWHNMVKYEAKSETLPSQLKDIFGLEMLDRIEAAFEGVVFDWHYNYNTYTNSLDSAKIIKDAKIHEYPITIDNQDYVEDLRGIMNNIIDNDGEFVFEY